MLLPLMPLVEMASLSQTETSTLTITGHVQSSDPGTELYILGHDSINSTSTLIVTGHQSSNNNVSLYTYGYADLNLTSTLIINGSISDNANITTYIDGIGTFEDDTVNARILYINGWAEALNSTINLFTFSSATAGASLANNNITLYMPESPAFSDTMYLFLKNIQTNVPLNVNMPLVMNAADYLGSLNNSLSLFLYHDKTYDTLPIYIEGTGFWEGYVTDNQSMTLFINRPNESWKLPLFCKALDDTVNSTMTLYTENSVSSNSNIPLVIPEPLSSANLTSTLYIGGVVRNNQNATLYIPGQTSLNTSFSLFLQQDNTSLNSTMTVYIMGVYKENDNIQLVIPSIDDTQSISLPIYVFGW